jgi:hypothetical protein
LVPFTKYYGDGATKKKRASMWHVWEKGEMTTSFWWGKLRERDHLDDLNVNGNIIIDRRNGTVGGYVHWNYMVHGRDRSGRW